MITTSPINLDLLKKTVSPIMLVQGETDGRNLRFLINTGGVSLSPTGLTVTFFMTKPDSNVVFAEATHDGTYYLVNISTQMVVVSGTAQAEFVIVSATETIRSVKFPIEIQPTSDVSGAVESTSEFTALEDVLTTINRKMNLAGGSANPFTAMPYVGTAPILESASGSDGTYVKYADGTMLWHLTKTIDYGSNIATATFSLTFPVAFYAAPSAISFVLKAYEEGVNTGVAVAAGTGDTTTTTFTGGFYRIAGNMRQVKASFFAIGRWKA